MADNSRIIASQDLTTAGFYDMADEWSDSRKIDKYGSFKTRDSYVEASEMVGLQNGDKVLITWADQGTHPSTIGDVGSNAGQTPNSGYYVYNSGLQKLVRTAPLEPEVAKGFSDIATTKAQQVTESQNAITTIKTDIDTKYSTIVSANTNVNTKASQVTADKDIVSQLKNDTLVIRNEALGFSGGKIKATYTEAAAITGLNDGDIVAVLASDTGTHASVSGDVGVSGGQTPNSGYYKYTTAVTALVRVGDLEAVIATNEADRAEAAADVSENARDVAIAAGVQYPTVAAAVAALADGAFGSYLDENGFPVWGQRVGATMVALTGPWIGFDKIGGLSPNAGWALPVSLTSTLAIALATLQSNVIADGTANDTAALVAWEDAVTAYAAGGSTIQTPSLNFGPRRYAVGSISKKSYGWRGAGTDNTRLVYNGTAGADFITQDTVTGRNSSGMLSDMTIDGQNCGTIYKIPQNSAGFGTDDRSLIERVRMVDGESHIHWDAYVNARGDNMRHDNFSGPALIIEPKFGQNQSHFEYNCTFDTNSNGQTTNSPPCFALLKLDGLATSANCGIIKFSGKRWEVNHAALSANKALIQVNTTSGSTRQAEIVLDGVTIQNSFAGGVDSLFHRSAGGSVGSERYAFRSVQMAGIGTNIFRGDYPTWMLSIPAGNWLSLIGDPINGFRGMRTVSSGATGTETFSPASNVVIEQNWVPGEAFPRRIVRPDVTLSGNGSSAPGVLLRHTPVTSAPPPSGTIARGAWSTYTKPSVQTISAYAGTTPSAGYVQAEATAVSNAVKTLRDEVAALRTQLDEALTALQTVSRTYGATANDLSRSGSGTTQGLMV